MNLHANAALSLNKRRLLARRVVEEKWTLSEAAAAAEVSVRTAQKWSARYREEGESGLLDRSSACERHARSAPYVSLLEGPGVDRVAVAHQPEQASLA